MKQRAWLRMLALLAVFGMFGAACASSTEAGSDDGDDDSTETTEASDDATTDETKAEDDAMEDEDSEDDSMEDESVASPYDGETVELLIPFDAGGGSDTWGRFLAPTFESYLGEDVKIVVKNDGGKTAAVNDYEQNTKHDGLTLVASSGSISLPFLLEKEGIIYDYASMSAIIGSPVGGIVYASPDTGVNSLADICGKTDGLIMGTKSISGLDMVPALALNLLGVEFALIDGNDGAGPIRAAFEAGDFNLSYDTSGAKSSADELFDAGTAVPLFTFGIVSGGELLPDPAWPDVPTMADAYTECNGETPSGEAWDAFLAVNTAGFAAQKNVWVHGDAPPEMIAALQAAAKEVVQDPTFVAESAELIGDYTWVAGADLDAQFASASKLPPEAKTFLCDWLQTDYEVGGICGG